MQVVDRLGTLGADAARACLDEEDYDERLLDEEGVVVLALGLSDIALAGRVVQSSGESVGWPRCFVPRTLTR